VVEVEFRGGGKSRLLRVFLDKCATAGSDPLAGVTHEDCARFSREFGTSSMWRTPCLAPRTRWKFLRPGWTAN